MGFLLPAPTHHHHHHSAPSATTISSSFPASVMPIMPTTSHHPTSTTLSAVSSLLSTSSVFFDTTTTFVGGDMTTTNLISSASSSSSLILPLISTTTTSFLSIDDIHGQIISNAFDPQQQLSIIASSMTSNTDNNSLLSLPLLLSCIAGFATCLGAGIVFMIDSKTITNYMSFILSLAASVMITVSIISIGPECLEGLLQIVSSNNNNNNIGVGVITQQQQQQPQSIELLFAGYNLQVLDPMGLWGRIISFVIGCTSYWLLSNSFLSIPEPEDLIMQQSSEFTTTTTATTTTTSTGKQQQQRTTTFRPPVDFKYSTSSSFPTTIARMTTINPPNPFQLFTSYSSLLSSASLDGGPDAIGSIPRPTPTPYTTTDNSNNSMQHTSITSAVAPSSPATMEGSSNNDNNNNNNVLDLHDENQNRYWRVTLLLFISLLFHNFPEGLAVAASTMESTKLGLAVTIGILIHNIPEGIAIAVPCIAAFPNKPWLAFWLASASGLAEPIGALVALNTVVVSPSSSSSSQQQQLVSTTTSMMPDLDNVLACVAGIMCAVAILELYPEALRHQPQQPQHIDMTVTDQNHMNGRSNTALILGDSNSNSNNNNVLTTIDSQVVWGTLVGIVIMVTTELYLAP